MGIRYDASGDSHSRTTNLPTITSFSMGGWFKFVTTTGWQSCLAFGTNSSGNYWSIQTNVDVGGFLSLLCSNGSVFINGAAGPTANVWVHLFATIAGTGAGQAIFYRDGVQYASGSGSTTPTNAKFWIGNNPDSDFFNGVAAYTKLYSGVLTPAEVYQEYRQGIPNRTVNLNGFYPFDDKVITNNTIDFSGSGNNLTAAGTLAFEDGPPVVWKKGRKRFIYISAGGTPVTVNITPVNLSFNILTPKLEHQINVVPKQCNFSLVAPNIQHELNTSPLSILTSVVAPNLQHQINTTPNICNFTIVSPGIQHEVNGSPLSISANIVTPNIQHQVNTTPLNTIITIVAPNTGQSIIVNTIPLSLIFSLVAPNIQHQINVSPVSSLISIVIPNIQHQINTGVLLVSCIIVSPNIQHQVTTTPLAIGISVVVPSLQHEVLTSPLNLTIIIVAPEVSGAIIVEPPTGQIYEPVAIQPKNNLFAAFKERLKFKQNIVSEFLLEDTPLPYLSLSQIFNVLSWKNSCLERFEESNFAISVYEEEYDSGVVDDIEQTLIYHNLLLNAPKKVIFLEQIDKEIEELRPQLYRTLLTYEIIVQKQINQEYILSPTSGETLNKCIYSRFQVLPLAGLVNDLVSPGYALENTNYPYLVVPKIKEHINWNHTKGKIDSIRYPIGCYAEDLNELIEIMDEIEKSFDYAKFILDGKNHLINEWVSTDIHELKPQLFRGVVNYEILVESPVL